MIWINSLINLSRLWKFLFLFILDQICHHFVKFDQKIWKFRLTIIVSWNFIFFPIKNLQVVLLTAIFCASICWVWIWYQKISSLKKTRRKKIFIEWLLKSPKSAQIRPFSWRFDLNLMEKTQKPPRKWYASGSEPFLSTWINFLIKIGRLRIFLFLFTSDQICHHFQKFDREIWKFRLTKRYFLA